MGFNRILSCPLKVMHGVLDVLLDISVLRLVIYLRVNPFLYGFNLFFSSTQVFIHKLLLNFFVQILSKLLELITVYFDTKLFMVRAIPLPEEIYVLIKEEVK